MYILRIVLYCIVLYCSLSQIRGSVLIFKGHQKFLILFGQKVKEKRISSEKKKKKKMEWTSFLLYIYIFHIYMFFKITYIHTYLYIKLKAIFVCIVNYRPEDAPEGGGHWLALN